MAKRSVARGIRAQGELFSPALDKKDYRDLISVMEFPMFGLSKRPDMVVREFGSREDKAFVRVSPGAKGIATMWDHDVLIFCCSKINAGANRGDEASSTVNFSAYEMLMACGRGTNKRAYEQLMDGLFRLQSTSIETNLKSGGREETRGFSWINDFRALTEADHVGCEKTARAMRASGNLRMLGLEVNISRWVFDAVSKDRKVLAISPDYFSLESGLERRLYQIARKHCGDQTSWTFSMGRLAEKVGTLQELWRFRADLAEVIERDNIPSYTYRIVEPTVEIVSPAGTRRRSTRRPRLDNVQVVIERRKGPHIGDRVLRKAAAQAQREGYGAPSFSAAGWDEVGDDVPASRALIEQ